MKKVIEKFLSDWSGSIVGFLITQYLAPNNIFVISIGAGCGGVFGILISSMLTKSIHAKVNLTKVLYYFQLGLQLSLTLLFCIFGFEASATIKVSIFLLVGFGGSIPFFLNSYILYRMGKQFDLEGNSKMVLRVNILAEIHLLLYILLGGYLWYFENSYTTIRVLFALSSGIHITMFIISTLYLGYIREKSEYY